MFVRASAKRVNGYSKRRVLKKSSHSAQNAHTTRSFSSHHFLDGLNVYTRKGKEMPCLFRGVENFSHVFDPLIGCMSNFNSFDQANTILDNSIFAHNKKWAACGVPMSIDYGVATQFSGENGCVLSVNFQAFPDVMLVDAETAFLRHYGDYYSDGREGEWAVFLIPQGAIEKFSVTVQGQPIQFMNPFFLKVNKDDVAMQKEIQGYYNTYCLLTHAFFLHKYSPSAVSTDMLEKLKLDFLKQHFSVYQACFGAVNPFQLSVNEFKEKNPEYSSVVQSLKGNPLNGALNSSVNMGEDTVQKVILGGKSIKQFAEIFDLPKERYDVDSRQRTALMQNESLSKKIKFY